MIPLIVEWLALIMVIGIVIGAILAHVVYSPRGGE